ASIGLGEDGPPHQPIEQLGALRSTPNLSTWRPADAVETAAAWDAALKRHGAPTALVLSRQTLPHQARTQQQLGEIERGGYVLKESILKDNVVTPELILIATGSEVGLAMDAAVELESRGKAVRVVSMPSTDTFDAQPASYREAVLPKAVTKRLAIEASHYAYWYKYVGLDGRIVGMDGFGESAPGGDLFKHFGFTVDNVVEQAEILLMEVS
ncbi:transketolase-like TK C-terminal-containing protein, partial [Litchfieldella anticariensis]|uniref:transketolase-like TK C-terminal-containing protein n=2 Tax=Litchfieldella anticariensis TaxID=258591 RepID=UPI002E802C66